MIRTRLTNVGGVLDGCARRPLGGPLGKGDDVSGRRVRVLIPAFAAVTVSLVILSGNVPVWPGADLPDCAAVQSAR